MSSTSSSGPGPRGGLTSPSSHSHSSSAWQRSYLLPTATSRDTTGSSPTARVSGRSCRSLRKQPRVVRKTPRLYLPHPLHRLDQTMTRFLDVRDVSVFTWCPERSRRVMGTAHEASPRNRCAHLSRMSRPHGYPRLHLRPARSSTHTRSPRATVQGATSCTCEGPLRRGGSAPPSGALRGFLGQSGILIEGDVPDGESSSVSTRGGVPRQGRATTTKATLFECRSSRGQADLEFLYLQALTHRWVLRRHRRDPPLAHRPTPSLPALPSQHHHQRRQSGETRGGPVD